MVRLDAVAGVPARMSVASAVHVHRLSTALRAWPRGDRQRPANIPTSPPMRRASRLRVVRVGDYPPIITFDDLVPWALQLNLAVQEQATRVALEGEFDVVHATTGSSPTRQPRSRTRSDCR